MAGASPRRAAASPKRPRKPVDNVPRWTTAEESHLRKLVNAQPAGKNKKWGVIAEKLGTNRSPQAVAQHWKLMNVLDAKAAGLRTTKTAKVTTKQTRSKRVALLMFAGAFVVTTAAGVWLKLM